MYFFTADTHFRDPEILMGIPRPFKSVDHMDSVMIKRFNERVGPDDTTFILGDFFHKVSGGTKPEEILAQLNGQKILIRGNHDKNNGVRTIIKHMTIEYFGQRILLIHDPKDAYDLMVKDTFDFVFHGHVHMNWQFQARMVNVGVDVWNYFPVSIKTALNVYDKWAKQWETK